MRKKITLNNRADLAQAITLIESVRSDHQKQAQALLEHILPKTGKSVRIGITGAPGVGKSTFIETFGLHVIGKGHKVAVLAVDPSSRKSGGSILGDKTRMSKLAQHKNAFIRPSPTGGSLGGVARRTREAILVCEAAGYDVIIVETVGVGQSETEVADMVDMFLLLLLPGSGDELQGIKKGIVELADLIIVNKADGDLKAQAKRVRADYSAALKLLRADGNWQPRAVTCSALTGDGIAGIWETVGEFKKSLGKPGMDRQRRDQAKAWMWKEIRERLIEDFTGNARNAVRIAAAEKAVLAGRKTPAQAAAELLEGKKK